MGERNDAPVDYKLDLAWNATHAYSLLLCPMRDARFTGVSAAAAMGNSMKLSNRWSLQMNLQQTGVRTLAGNG